MSVMTREKLLNEADHLMRERGYSAFSYADLSKSIGITKASIHHHFPTKDVLGEQVVIQAHTDTKNRFEQIEKTENTVAQMLTAYVELFIESYRTSRMPLCCALSAEMANIRVQATEYFDMQIAWLTKIVSRGVDAGELTADLPPSKMALLILNLCEGASVVSRAINKPELFNDTLEQILMIVKRK
mgnify:CR=1 FL=1